MSCTVFAPEKFGSPVDQARPSHSAQVLYASDLVAATGLLAVRGLGLAAAVDFLELGLESVGGDGSSAWAWTYHSR
jgi:hypothetical protein